MKVLSMIALALFVTTHSFANDVAAPAAGTPAAEMKKEGAAAPAADAAKPAKKHGKKKKK